MFRKILSRHNVTPAVQKVIAAIYKELDSEARVSATDQVTRLAEVMGSFDEVTLRFCTARAHSTREVLQAVSDEMEKAQVYAVAVALLDQQHYSARNYLNDLAEGFAMPPKMYRALREQPSAWRSCARQAAA